MEKEYINSAITRLLNNCDNLELVDKLKTLGLRVISVKNVENRFRYFEKEIIFSW